MDDENEILHDKRWGVYINKKVYLIKVVYYVEVSGYDGRKVV